MMRMFQSVPIAHEVHRLEAVPPRAQAYPHVGVTLGWEERLKARGRRRTDEGLEFATTLGRGTVLRAGDCFVLDAPEVVIRVIEKEESVFVITPATAREFALCAYQVGNSHQPVMLTDTEIVCADVPGMEQVLDYHRMVFARARRVFIPVGQILDHHRQGSQ